MADRIDVERLAVRALLLTPKDEVLLMRILPPDGGSGFWIAPGGGLEPGEGLESGLKRELSEEVGITEFVIGPVVWLRQHTFNWSVKRIRQKEQYVVVHIDHFNPIMSDQVESKYLDRFRWWRIADLANTKDRLTPLSLADIVARYMEYGPPTEVLAVEVLED